MLALYKKSGSLKNTNHQIPFREMNCYESIFSIQQSKIQEIQHNISNVASTAQQDKNYKERIA